MSPPDLSPVPQQSWQGLGLLSPFLPGFSLKWKAAEGERKGMGHSHRMGQLGWHGDHPHETFPTLLFLANDPVPDCLLYTVDV